MSKLTNVRTALFTLSTERAAEETKLNAEIVPLRDELTRKEAAARIETTEKIDALKAVLAVTLNGIETERRNRLVPMEHTRNEKLAAFDSQYKEMQHALHIQDYLELVPTKIHPNVIDVPHPGRKMVILQFPNSPEYGMMLWNDQEGGTRWAISIGDSGFRGTFYLPCACCSIPTQGRKDEAPTKDQTCESYKEWADAIKTQFQDDLEKVCAQHGIDKLFGRRVASWESSFVRKPTFQLFEGDAWLGLTDTWPLRDLVQTHFKLNA